MIQSRRHPRTQPTGPLAMTQRFPVMKSRPEESKPTQTADAMTMSKSRPIMRGNLPDIRKSGLSDQRGSYRGLVFRWRRRYAAPIHT